MPNYKRPPPPASGLFWLIRSLESGDTVWSPVPEMICVYTSEELAWMAIGEFRAANFAPGGMTWPELVQYFGSSYEKILVDYFPSTDMGHTYDLKI